MGQPGTRRQRSRKAGARMPSDAVYVGRGAGRVGRWGNPFRVGGAATIALAVRFKADSWRGRQWSATRLYALWIAGRLGELAPEVHAAALAELEAQGNPVAPTREEIVRDLNWSGWHGGQGRDLVCWCQPFVDCHADILLAVAIGQDPVIASGTSPHWADNFRCIEIQRTEKRVEIRDNIRRRSYVKGWTAW